MRRGRRRPRDIVRFRRGGQEVELHKMRDKIAVKFRDHVVPNRLAGRLGRELDLPMPVRYMRRFGGEEAAIFHVPSSHRDAIMRQLRRHRDDVQYCSHLLQRFPEGQFPGDELGIASTLFVQFEGEPSVAEVQDIEAAHGVRAVWRFPERPDGIVFHVTSDAKSNPLKIANALYATKRFVTAEPCLIDTKAPRAVPNDWAFDLQWHLLNTGQGGGVPGADCNATAAWDHTWGDPSITIAIIDDGFDVEHPDLGPDRIVAPYDATQRDVDPSPESLAENHGTACAGVAIAKRSGGLTVGVAPDCSWMPIRHAGELGDLEEALAFYHAYRNDADVISCSWGPYDAYQNQLWPMPSLTKMVIDVCLEHGRAGRGIPILFAAGNGNESLDLDGYANYEPLIAVAAVTNEDEKSSYSDYGDGVWVCAPSSGGTRGVVTTDRRGHFGYSQLSDYTTTFGGTSASTPLVAGVVGLMLSVNPELTVAQVKQILKETAVQIHKNDPPQVRTDFWGNTYSDAYDGAGHSQVYGWGRVDAGAAVRAALTL